MSSDLTAQIETLKLPASRHEHRFVLEEEMTDALGLRRPDS